MFVDAKRVTLKEWLNKSNDKDIITLKNGMKQYTLCLLNATLYRHMKQLGDELRKLPLWQLSRKLEEAAYQLQKRQEEQVVAQPSPGWDAEYNRLVPVDFYFRNVESVTASGAFHFMVLHAFSRNESKLVRYGYLKPLSMAGTEPEIRIFSNPETRYPEAIDVIENVLKTLLA